MRKRYHFSSAAASSARPSAFLAQALEQIQLRAALKAAQQDSVSDFLSHYEPKPTIDVRPQAGM